MPAPVFREDAEVVEPDTIALDLSRLLGFRDLGGVGLDEAELAAALDAAHVKIGAGEQHYQPQN